MNANIIRELISGLDSKILEVRISSLRSLRQLELQGGLKRIKIIGPALPNYIHIHTTASYGYGVPGVFSASHMIWAAHEVRARTILLIEHESVLHMKESLAATEIVNRDAKHPLRLIFGVEFKAPIALNDKCSRQFSREIGAAWGQSEAAWVVAAGIKPQIELDHLVARFQDAKRHRALQQVDKLCPHLGISPSFELSSMLAPDGNVTDRSLSFALAKIKWPHVNQMTWSRQAQTIRQMLNPGGAGYVPFPDSLPIYQDLIGDLAKMDSLPIFTAQLRGKALETNLPVLKSWGIRGLDIAGIEPDESEAEGHIQKYVQLADQQDILIIGGADYRGHHTGWLKHSPWMDHPSFAAGIKQLQSP